MQNKELADIESSVQALVHRAYEAGRNDVLKRVVDVLKADPPVLEHLALAAPEPAATPAPAPQEKVPELPAAEPHPAEEPRPWWARPMR